MNRPRNQFFASAALAADENSRISLGDFIDERAQTAHGLAFANDGFVGLQHLAKPAILRFQRLKAEHILQRDGGDAGGRVQELHVVFGESRLEPVREQVDDANGVLHSDQRHAHDVFRGGDIGRRFGED